MSTETEAEVQVQEPQQEAEAYEDAGQEGFSAAQQRHYDEIVESQRKLAKLETAMEAAKEKAKAAKGQYELALEQLVGLIRRGPDRQARLPGMEDVDKPLPWPEVPLADLGLSDGILNAMAEAELKTLGNLVEWQEAEKHLTDIPKIGEAKADEIEEALQRFWEEHPEYCDAQPAADDEAP